MIDTNELLQIFLDAADLEPEGESSVFLGFLAPVDSTAGLDAMLKKHTTHIDMILLTKRMSKISRAKIQAIRCFTYKEYQCLFDRSIKEDEMREFPIFNTLFIATDKQRRLFTRSRDDSYEAYLALLKAFTKVNNPYLNSLLYEVHFERTNK